MTYYSVINKCDASCGGGTFFDQSWNLNVYFTNTAMIPMYVSIALSVQTRVDTEMLRVHFISVFTLASPRALAPFRHLNIVNKL